MSAPLGEYHAFIDGLVWKRNGYLADAVREERFWCPRPDLLHAHSVLPQHCIEAPLELGVMIAQQDRLLARMVGQKTERLSGTFGGPRLGRLGTRRLETWMTKRTKTSTTPRRVTTLFEKKSHAYSFTGADRPRPRDGAPRSGGCSRRTTGHAGR
jgi:hypothetical protein